MFRCTHLSNSWSNLSLNHSLHNPSLMKKIDLCMDCKTRLRKTHWFYFPSLGMAGREVVNLINLLHLCPNGFNRVFPKFIMLVLQYINRKFPSHVDSSTSIKHLIQKVLKHSFWTLQRNHFQGKFQFDHLPSIPLTFSTMHSSSNSVHEGLQNPQNTLYHIDEEWVIWLTVDKSSKILLEILDRPNSHRFKK